MGPTFDENDGDFFDPSYVVGTGLTRWQGTGNAKESITFKLGHLKNIILGCLIINSDNVIPLIQRTNNRVYKAFQSLDTSLVGSVYQGSDFAGRYKLYMEDRATLFNKAPGLVTRMIDDIQKDLLAALNLPDVVSSERGSLAKLLVSYKSLYTIGNLAQQWQFQVDFEWDVNNVKRDFDGLAMLEYHKLKHLIGRQAASTGGGGDDGGSCPLTAAGTASLPDASGFATGGVTNGGGGQGSGGGNGPTQTTGGEASATGPAAGQSAGQGSGGANGPSQTGAQGSAGANGPTKTKAPASTKPPASQTSGPVACQSDDDCEDYKCSSGDPFCAIAISKNKLRREILVERPRPDKVKRQATKTTAADASFPTGFCGCKNQDTPTSTTKVATPAPVPSGCDDGGLYDDFDKCSDHCSQGFCQENAGQPQVTCSCN